jgi:hypothetical protein
MQVIMKKLLVGLCCGLFFIIGDCFAQSKEAAEIANELVSNTLNFASKVKKSSNRKFEKFTVPTFINKKKLTSEETRILKLVVAQFMSETGFDFVKGIYTGNTGDPAFKIKINKNEFFEMGINIREYENNKRHVSIGVYGTDWVWGGYIFNAATELTFSCMDLGDNLDPLKNFYVCASTRREFVTIDGVDRRFESEITEQANRFLQGASSRSSLEDFWRKRLERLQKEILVEDAKNRKNLESSKSRVNVSLSNTLPNIDGVFIFDIETNADTASLKINGEELGGRSDGKYSIKKVARAGGDTQFTIVATDINGNTDTKTVTVSRPVVESKPSFTALNPAQVKRQPERDAVAVIIGIADYKNLPRADYANDDARVFYDYAIRALGIKSENIKLLVDADADDVAIYQAFKTWLPSRVRASSDVYVYYSGHGLPTADGKGLYLLPQRAHRDFIDRTAITQAEINAAIQAAKPKSVTVFLDSCYSGQARSGETLIASARPVAMKAEKQLFPDNFTVITASQADQISSSSPDLKHGIFSYYLMRGMEGDADANRDGKITAGEMQAYLTETVPRQAGMQNRVQQPQLIGDVNRVLVGR